MRLRLLSLAAICVLAALPLGATPAPEQIEFFEKKIRPVLAEKCQVCHSPQMKTSGLDLSSAAGFVHGGESGPLVNQENPAESRLLKVISYEEKLKMPPTGKLDREVLADFKTWVEMGAPWPGVEEVEEVRPQKQVRKFTEEEKNFWAFQPVRDPEPPELKREDWTQSEIDRFILAKLEKNGLEPAPPAPKEALLRRATFDLTGLPPSEKEMAAFLADDSPDAFAKAVDRLLASPRYGERWGRHWLDVARYADSTGNDEDHRYPYAWRYRDYVIDAFNDDLPYDQFIREQIAGDLLPTGDPSGINRRGIVATGLLALGPKAIAQQDKMRMLYDVYDEQLDVVSKAFLGLTVSCARCHDHKFDPILQRDYYSMIGIFASTRSFKDPQTHVSKLLFVPLVPQEEYERYKAEQEKIQNRKLELDDLADIELEQHAETLAPRLADYMTAARRVYDDGAELETVAAETGLDAAMLKKWTAYLGNAGKDPHLEEWRQAAKDSRAAVAAAYQQRFEATMKQWHAKLNRWRQRVRKMLKEANMPPPPRPKFTAADDRFFHEAYLAKGGPFHFSPEEREKILRPETKRRIAELEKEVEQLEKNAMPEPPMACAVTEGEPVQQKVFIRGDYSNPGEDAPKMYPAVLEGFDQQPVRAHGSGRLELANWIASADNPLTARVMANRVWHWHFGEGIVRTPSNFGKTGERPTHPELLDWLAKRLMEDGWSVKKLHRRIMLSSAYQMSTRTSDRHYEADPENRLFSRFNRRRLEVEEIRDALLAIDGSIDFTMGGSLQEGFGTDRENSNARLSPNPEDYTRRTVYLPLRRANLPPLLNLFDFGDAVTPLGRRPVTNVAPQALFMMNSEFVAERSKNLAQQLLEAEQEPSARLERAYRRILNRTPTADEADQGLTYLAKWKSRYSERGDEEAWASLCRVLMASNEFIYVD